MVWGGRARVSKAEWLLLFASGYGLSACTEATPADSVQTRTLAQPLTLDTAPRIDLENWNSKDPLVERSSRTQLSACTAESCLLVYTQEIDFTFYESESHVYGVRFDANEQLLDSPPIHYGRGLLLHSLTVSEGDYIATWVSTVSGQANRAARLDGATGALIEDLSSNLPTGTNHRVTGGDDTLLLSYRDQNTEYVQVLDTSWTPVGPTATFLGNTPGVAYGGGQYLVAWSESAMRISESTGEPLDDSPIVYTLFWPGSPRVVFSDDTYLLAWETDGGLYASRIRASDGTVLDPDTDQPGATVVCDDCLSGCSGQQAAGLRLNRLGSGAVATWPTLAFDGSSTCAEVGAIEGARLSFTTGEVTATFDVEYSAELSSSVPQPGERADGSWYVHGSETLRSMDADENDFSPVFGEEVRYCYELPYRRDVRVATNGETFLVVWGSHTVVNDLRAARVDTETGTVLDLTPMVLANTFASFDVTSDGTDYLVAWAAAGIERRFVEADGTLGIELPAQFPDDTSLPSGVALTHNGSNFLAGWTSSVLDGYDLFARLLSAAGNPLGLQGFNRNGGTSSDRVWLMPRPDSEAPHDFFVASLTADLGGEVHDLPAEGGLGTDLEYPGFSGDVAVAPGGTAAALFWYYDNTINFAGTQGMVLGDATGEGEPGVAVLLDICETCRVRRAWHDGEGYLLAIHDEDTDELLLHAYDNDLTPTMEMGDPVQAWISNGAVGIREVGIAGVADAEGRSLLVYEEKDPAQVGVPLRAAWVDRDGVATATSGTGGSGGTTSTGSGGSGGASSSESGGSSSTAPGTGGATGDDGASTDGSGGSQASDTGGSASGGQPDGTNSADGDTGGVSDETGGGAGANSDSGASTSASPNGDSGESGGCSCALPGQGASPRGPFWLVLLASATTASRRRRRSRPTGPGSFTHGA